MSSGDASGGSSSGGGGGGNTGRSGKAAVDTIWEHREVRFDILVS